MISTPGWVASHPASGPESRVGIGSLAVERLAALVQNSQLTEAVGNEVDDVLGWLSGVSDDEVTALLAKESRRRGAALTRTTRPGGPPPM
ncbi:hypothetical protein ACIBW9_35235 [Streptomyces sp. NPDC049541]|uniref:hypothetical protein n=1 Tax=Streptomyces sp. NPDC049541 TaxID=3365594 RepID=UPI00378E2F79